MVGKFLKIVLALALAVGPQGFGGKAGVGGKAGFGGGASLWKTLQTAVNFSCSNVSTSCSVTVASTTANSALACIVGSEAALATPTNIKIVSCSGGGGSWTLCAASGCYFSQTSVSSVDAAYNTTGTGSATSISVTITGNPGAGWFLSVTEFQKTSGNPSLDVVGGGTGSASCSNCTFVAFTGGTATTGARDAIVQVGNVTGTPTTTDANYVVDSNGLMLTAINMTPTLSATAPVIVNTPTGGFSTTALAFK